MFNDLVFCYKNIQLFLRKYSFHNGVFFLATYLLSTVLASHKKIILCILFLHIILFPFHKIENRK